MNKTIILSEIEVKALEFLLVAAMNDLRAICDDPKVKPYYDNLCAITVKIK